MTILGCITTWLASKLQEKSEIAPNIKTKIPRASCTGEKEIFALYRSLCGITLLRSELLQMDGLLLAAWKAPIWDGSPKIRNFWMLTLSGN